MPRRFLLGAALLLTVGCRVGASSSRAPDPTSQPTASATAAPVPTTAAAAPLAAGPAPGPSPSVCGYGPSTRIATLQDRAVAEASGLAASRRAPDVYWTLNDSNNDPLLFAFDRAGRALGTFRVDGARNSDWEALQAGPAPNGEPALYVGDIGDNQATRQDIQVYRVPAPALDPNATKPMAGTARPAERFFLSYPDGAHDAAALLVHPTSGELLIVTKSFAGQSQVYRAPPLTSAGRIALEHVADLDLTGLGPFAGIVTDGAFAPDGRRVALRTYVAVLEYAVPPGQSLAATWNGVPDVYPLQDGRQGEGITYRADGEALLTIGEGAPAELYQNERQC